MKKRFFWMVVVITLMIGASSFQALADKDKTDKDKSRATGYNNMIPYDGAFKADAIYNRPSPTVTARALTWQGSRGPTRLTQIRCITARKKIDNYGVWTGNLDRAGNCLDPGEPMQWTLGNYLNFLQSKPKTHK
ncbi:MAG: hypothetical protein L3J63_03945 [Geopsychrobacter sp.]|nr:hypothetical protein [Geopsychrobacter sp.]